jgi:diguanylate cyclase (GGDEF)-like protein
VSRFNRWSSKKFANEPSTVVEKGDVLAGTAPAWVGIALTVVGGSEAGRLEMMGPDGGVIGRGEGVEVAFVDFGVSRAHVRISRAPDGYSIKDLDSHNGTWVDEIRLEGTVQLAPHCRIRLGPSTVIQFAALDEMGVTAFDKLRAALLLDPLTGTGKRSFLERRLREEFAYSQRHGTPLAVMLVDVDHFKNINDDLGHTVGDRALAHVAGVLKEVVRREDCVFRYGGDEFCVIVRGTESAGLVAMARRLRSALHAAPLMLEDGELRITASIGVAGAVLHREELPSSRETFDEDDVNTESDLVTLADRALYLAKRRGRDRVHTLWSSGLDSE